MFFDDYWLSLAFLSGGFAALMLLNTEQATADDMNQTRTVFHFNIQQDLPIHGVRLHFNRGGYKPSPEEDLLAPFYRDPSQQIVAVELHNPTHKSVFVMKIDILLKLARECGGADLKLEQLRAHMVEILPRDHHADLWVSGSRLFRICRRWDNRKMWMDVFDFSARASTRQLGTNGSGWTMRPSIEARCLPWDAYMTHFSDGGHDSIAHLMVRTLLPRHGRDLTEVFYGRGSTVVVVCSRLQCICGTFSGPYCLVSAQPRIEYSISFPKSLCVLIGPVAQQEFIWVRILCNIVLARRKPTPLLPT